MADTQRTLAAIQALYADNTAGDISPQDARDFIVSALGGYGVISVSAGVTAQGSIGTSPLKLTAFATDGLSDGGTTVDNTDDSIQIDVGGIWLCAVQLTLTGTNAEQFDFELRKNAAATGFKGFLTTAATSVEQSVTVIGLVSFTATDKLTVYVNASAAGKSVTVSEGQLVAVRVA